MVLQVLWACTLDLDTEEDFNRLFNCGLMGVLHGLCGIMDIARGAKWLTTRYGDSMALTFSVSACLSGYRCCLLAWVAPKLCAHLLALAG